MMNRMYIVVAKLKHMHATLQTPAASRADVATVTRVNEQGQLPDHDDDTCLHCQTRHDWNRRHRYQQYLAISQPQDGSLSSGASSRSLPLVASPPKA